MTTNLNNVNNNSIIVNDQTSANLAATGSGIDKKIIFVNKTREQVAQSAADRGTKFRQAMIVSGIAATCAVAVKIALVAGVVGVAFTPVGWVLGGLAALTALVAIGILIHRHLKATEEGYNPKSLQELGIGLYHGVAAGAITAVTILVVCCIVAAVLASGGKGCGGGGSGGGGSGNFLQGFFLGHALGNSHCYSRPIYLGSMHHHHHHYIPNVSSRGPSVSADRDVADERFENRNKIQYLYRNDKIILPSSPAKAARESMYSFSTQEA